MVGQAHSSLVSGDRELRRRTLTWLLALDIGFLLGSFVVVTISSVLGSLFSISNLNEDARAWTLVGAIMGFLVFDVPAAVRGRHSRLGLSRQTPKWLEFYRVPRNVVALFWGADVGTGVSTYRMTSGIWLGLLAVFLELAPWWVVWLYGLGIVVSISALVAFTGGGSAVARNLGLLLGARHWPQRLYVLASGSVGVALVISTM